MRVFAAAFFASVLVIPALAVAQRISLGIIGGSSITNDYSGSGAITRTFTPTPSSPGGTMTVTAKSSAWQPMIGARIEFSLTGRLSFEANAIRRPSEWKARYDFDPPWNPNGTLITTLSERTPDVTWEVPLLIKYRFPALRALRRLSPLVEAGPSLRPWLYAQGNAHAGVTAGAGFHLLSHGINFEPVIRYTRWGTPSISYPQAKIDQLEMLNGVTGSPSSGRPEVLGRRLQFGFVGGFGLMGDFQPKEGYASALSKMAGVSIGTAVTGRWSIEMNAMYRPRILSEMQRATVLTWEFPILASYQLTTGHWLNPFAEVGPAFRSSGNTNNSNPSRFGVAAGVGVETDWHGLRFRPRIRYTHWSPDPPSDFPPQQPFSRRNQVDALVSFIF